PVGVDAPAPCPDLTERGARRQRLSPVWDVGCRFAAVVLIVPPSLRSTSSWTTTTTTRALVLVRVRVPGVDLEEPCDVEHVMSAELQQVFLPVVYALIFTLGITGNGLVIETQPHRLLSPAPLAADLLFVLALPFWAVDAALPTGASDVLILAFISLTRRLPSAVCPLPRRVILTPSPTLHLLASAGAWLPAGLLAVPDLIFARTQEGGEGSTLCQRFYPADNAPLWVAVFHLQLVLVGLVIPGLVLLVCYCVIVTRLTRGPLGGQRQKRRAVRTTIALVLCFFVCWLPYGAGISVDPCWRLEVLPRSCSQWAFAHCCLNPLLYAFLVAGFKSSARRALTLSRASSLKMLPRRRPGASTTTESESSVYIPASVCLSCQCMCVLCIYCIFSMYNMYI
uniref:Chemokine (C-X-C motif) receptor 4a n=1 Tax=Salarias fasciatus TaxID=181472 RepID=A0A672I6L1_SALFA